jgi:hypothetical protein
MASSIETTSTTTTLKNNGNTYLSVDTNDVVALTNPLPLASGGTGIATATTAIVQIVNTQTGAVATGTTIIPLDDTIPQNTEGDEYMTLAITPTSATNKLAISVLAIYAFDAQAHHAIALFQDTTAGALAVSASVAGSATGQNVAGKLFHTMTSGTTSATTFKIRIGADRAGTTTFNGAAGARKYGGVLASSITITEYTA